MTRETPRWKGWKALVHDVVDGITHLVEEGHSSGARLVLRITDQLGPVAGPARAIDDLRRAWLWKTLGTVRGVNRAVEWVVDGCLAEMAPPADPGPIPLRSDAIGTGAWLEDAALGLIAAAVGDRLGHGPLDLGMRLRYRDTILPLQPTPRMDQPKLVVLVHGLGTTEWCWALGARRALGDAGANFGTLLERDLGLEPIYARYNSGRAVATNGRALADRLETLCRAWNPAQIVLLGHSLGGRVAQGAVRVGAEDGHAWISRLTDIVCLCTPNRGAPLAGWVDVTHRTLAGVDLPAPQVLARILAARSAATHDLRECAPPVPPMPHVRRTFLAATATSDPDHPVGRFVGDGLVSADSAAGKAPHDRTFGRMHHYQVLTDRAVYEVLRALLQDRHVA